MSSVDKSSIFFVAIMATCCTCISAVNICFLWYVSSTIAERVPVMQIILRIFIGINALYAISVLCIAMKDIRKYMKKE